MRRPLTTRDTALVAGLVAVIVALPSLRNGFAYDDVWIVAQNPVVREPGGIWHILTTTYWPPTEGHGALWRPLTLAAFRLEWLLGGGAPLVFHIVTVLLAGIAAALVAGAVGTLFGPLVALVAGVLFAVHPVHVEVTATVVGQAELWAAVAYLGAVLAAWRAAGAAAPQTRMRWTGLMAVALLLGLGAKEHVVTFPLVLGLVWWRRAHHDGRPFGAILREQTATALLATGAVVAYLLARAAVLGDAASAGGIATGLDPTSPWRRLAVMLPVSLRWLELLFFPWHLSVDYSPQYLVPDPRFGLVHLAALGVWLALGVAAWRSRARVPALFFGCGWFAITIAIVSNVIVPLEVLLAERLLFLPSVGWAMAVAGVAVTWAREARARVVVSGLVAALAVAFAIRSAWRAPVWRSNDTVFRQMLREAPNSYRTHWALGAQAFAQGDSTTGEREWREAIRLNPEHPQPLEDLGRLYTRTGRWEAAIPLLERVIALDSSRAGSALALGTAYTRAGRLTEAEAFLATMERRHEQEAMFPALRADVLRRLGDYPEALDAARTAVRRDSTQWQLWLLAAETAGLGGACDAMHELADGARRHGGPGAAATVDRVLDGVANRNGSCK